MRKKNRGRRSEVGGRGADESVGWVERSETHHSGHGLNPSYPSSMLLAPCSMLSFPQFTIRCWTFDVRCSSFPRSMFDVHLSSFVSLWLTPGRHGGLPYFRPLFFVRRHLPPGSLLLAPSFDIRYSLFVIRYSFLNSHDVMGFALP